MKVLVYILHNRSYDGMHPAPIFHLPLLDLLLVYNFPCDMMMQQVKLPRKTSSQVEGKSENLSFCKVSEAQTITRKRQKKQRKQLFSREKKERSH